MKKIKLKIYLSGATFRRWRFLIIHPFIWFLWPIKQSNNGGSIPVPDPPNKWIRIYTFQDGVTKLEDCKTDRYPTQFRIAKRFKFLCFTMGYTHLYLTEVGQIYGTDYDRSYETELEEVRKKYYALCESGYFN